MEKSYFAVLKSAPDPLMAGLRLRPEAGAAILDYHQIVMRGESELSTGFRELIAAFVSGLNGCPLCRTAHTRVAELVGFPAETSEALLRDVTTAPLKTRERQLMAYVRKVVLAPSTLDARDAEAVFGAGWSEDAFHDALNVVCIFSFINRFVLGHGITATPEALEASAQKLASKGYG